MYWSLVSTGEVPWKIAHGATDQRSRFLCVIMPLVDIFLSAFLGNSTFKETRRLQRKIPRARKTFAKP